MKGSREGILCRTSGRGVSHPRGAGGGGSGRGVSEHIAPRITLFHQLHPAPGSLTLSAFER